MSLFANQHEATAWFDNWCEKCFQPDEARLRVTGKGSGCPLRAMAYAGVQPEQWTKRRKAEMGNTYKCDDFLKRAPVQRRAVAPPQTEALFDDVEPGEKLLVPVDGWPDYAAQARKGSGDHQ